MVKVLAFDLTNKTPILRLCLWMEFIKGVKTLVPLEAFSFLSFRMNIASMVTPPVRLKREFQCKYTCAQEILDALPWMGLFWTSLYALDRIELHWITLNRIELRWVALNRIEWCILDPELIFSLFIY